MSVTLINAFRCERIVSVVRTANARAKAFQVRFHRDGSLFISFPYFKHRTGILCSAIIPATGQRQTQVDLERGGKVTSHLVKYSHHPDGRAHFSQDGKILTVIKRQSIALDTQHGHLFSLIIQGLSALDRADALKDAGISRKRGVIDFIVGPSAEAIKFVGRWYDINKMHISNPTPTIGPKLIMVGPDGTTTNAMLVASPYSNARHVLAINCLPIPKVAAKSEVFCFYGGFDPSETMTDPTKEAGFLGFVYPLSETDEVRQRVGSVDYF